MQNLENRNFLRSNSGRNIKIAAERLQSKQYYNVRFRSFAKRKKKTKCCHDNSCFSHVGAAARSHKSAIKITRKKLETEPKNDRTKTELQWMPSFCSITIYHRILPPTTKRKCYVDYCDLHVWSLEQ